MEYNEKILKIINNNTDEYNWKKLAEELFELGEVAMKMTNKKLEFQPPRSKFIEEAGDVLLRIDILSLKMGLAPDLKTRIREKSEKLCKFIDEGKYKGGC